MIQWNEVMYNVMIKTISLEIDQVLTKSSISSRILIEIDKILSNSRDSLEICSK